MVCLSGFVLVWHCTRQAIGLVRQTMNGRIKKALLMTPLSLTKHLISADVDEAEEYFRGGFVLVVAVTI